MAGDRGVLLRYGGSDPAAPNRAHAARGVPPSDVDLAREPDRPGAGRPGRGTGPVLVPLEPLGRFDARAIPEASGIVGSRRHPGSSGSTTTRGTPPCSSRSGATAGSSAGSGWRSRTSTGKTSPSTARAISTSATSATTAGCCASGRSTGSTSPTRRRRRAGIATPRCPPPAVSYTLPPATASTPRACSSTAVPRSWSKYRDGREAELFAVADRSAAGGPRRRPRSARSAGSRASPSPPRARPQRGRHALAVCSYAVARVYRRGESARDDWKLLAEVAVRADAVEAITWDDAT